MRPASRKNLLLASPAKINLFLDVLDRRPDGYHEISTLFERVSLFDRIRLTPISGDRIAIRSQSKDIPLNRKNLAFRAAALIRKSCGIRQGLAIEIEKHIPVGAGLGGGSSNAATVLLGANKLFGLKIRRRDLLGLASQIGSDVPFFVLGKRFALGRGRGEELEAVPLHKSVKLWHILFVPPIKVFTKDVYALLDRGEKKRLKVSGGRKSFKLTKKMVDVNILLSVLSKRRFFLLNRYIYNRLSKNVMATYGLVSALKRELGRLGLREVHMSGSGPTLFVNFSGYREALNVYEKLQQLSDRCQMFLVSTR